IRCVTLSCASRKKHSAINPAGTPFHHRLRRQPQTALSLDRKALNHTDSPQHPHHHTTPHPRSPGTPPPRHSFHGFHSRHPGEHVTWPPPPTNTPGTPHRTRPGLGQNSSRTRHLPALIAAAQDWEPAQEDAGTPPPTPRITMRDTTT